MTSIDLYRNQGLGQEEKHSKKTTYGNVIRARTYKCLTRWGPVGTWWGPLEQMGFSTTAILNT